MSPTDDVGTHETGLRRYEVQEANEGWLVADIDTGLPVRGLARPMKSRREAQALADFHNVIARPIDDRVQPRLESIRRALKAIFGLGMD
jgi:hypothetical protein